MAFWNNIRFPYFNFQELNLDWIMSELKRIAGFMPQDGNVGDILTRKSDGAAWEPPEAVNININALPEDTEIGDNDQLIFYDISAQANRKIKPPNLLDSMMSNGTPLMDGTASPGTSKKPARYDHKHPTDTSRQAALSGTQMNAVNSGAPANSFNNGKLGIANGGTDVDNLNDLISEVVYGAIGRKASVNHAVTIDFLGSGPYLVLTEYSVAARLSAFLVWGKSNGNAVALELGNGGGITLDMSVANKISLTSSGDFNCFVIPLTALGLTNYQFE